MALSPVQFRRVLVDRLTSKQVAGLTWPDIVSAMNAANIGQQQRILSGIRRRNAGEVGELVIRIIERETAQARAEAEADAILADGTLSPDEVERVFL